MTVTLSSVTPEIERDRWGRPMVLPPNGKKKVAYTRCTTYVGVLEDLFNLQRWQQRMVILGLVSRPDLLLSAAAHREDKTKLDAVAEDAIEAAKAHAAATVGIALHALTEHLDAGRDIGPVPGEYQRDLDAYMTATKPLTVLQSETFTVLDELRIGGTPDRVVQFEGANYIADLKTGSISYGAGKIAMQLAVYAHSQAYDHKSGRRTPLPDVSQTQGIVIHLPAGTGTCQLHWVDIAAGWEAVQLATQVREWRTRKNLMSPFAGTDEALQNLQAAGLIGDPLIAQREAAATPQELVAIWQANETAWQPAHTAAASARKTQLAQNLLSGHQREGERE